MLVPATKGRGNTVDIMFDYLGALDAIKPKYLHFDNLLMEIFRFKSLVFFKQSLLMWYSPKPADTFHSAV